MKHDQEKELLDYLEEKQYATVEELSAKLFVSQSSVRRRLTSLQEKGLVIRTHGGVKISEANNFFPTFSFRSHLNSSEKKKIALTAVDLVKDGDVVFLDGSTSAFFMAEYLKSFKNLRVITNGIDTLSLLSKNKIDAYSTGGRISNTNRSALVGQIALNSVRNFHADVAFFSAHSVSSDGQIYDCFEEENYVRREMMKNTTKKVFICDSSKLGFSSPYKLCTINDIDCFVCDKDVSSFFTVKNLPKILY